MLRIKNISFATLKYQEAKGSSVFLSSFHLVGRRFSKEAEEMSGRSLPKWIAPEGCGELKLYNSLTREKVWFRNCIFCCFFFFHYYFFFDLKTMCRTADATWPVDGAIKLIFEL